MRRRPCLVLLHREPRVCGLADVAEDDVADLPDALRVLEAELLLRPWGDGSRSGGAHKTSWANSNALEGRNSKANGADTPWLPVLARGARLP